MTFTFYVKTTRSGNAIVPPIAAFAVRWWCPTYRIWYSEHTALMTPIWPLFARLAAPTLQAVRSAGTRAIRVYTRRDPRRIWRCV